MLPISLATIVSDKITVVRGTSTAAIPGLLGSDFCSATYISVIQRTIILVRLPFLPLFRFADCEFPLFPLVCGRSAAGLRPVGSVCPDAGVRDVDLLAAGLVSGHTDYPAQMGRIMAEVGMA